MLTERPLADTNVVALARHLLTIGYQPPSADTR